MNSKYQIFVSSTFNDLKDERDLVIKAILEMGHIPVGMEMFSAADEEQWNIIKKQIDESDYYVVISAHRYGSIAPDGLSYTEKEYDYARSKGIPTLGFVIHDLVSWPREKSDSETGIIAKLNAFKEKIKSKHVSFWRSTDDLYGKCSIALTKAFSAYPREGWVRASSVQDIAASKEIIRLSAENAELRKKVEEIKQKEDKASELIKIAETLRANDKSLYVWKKGDTKWEIVKNISLYQVFEAIAPILQFEADLTRLATYYAQVICKIPAAELRVNWPVPRNMIQEHLGDLAAYGLVAPSKRKKPVSDNNEYWSLDQRGFELLALMRRRRLEKTEMTEEVNPGGVDVEQSIPDLDKG